MRPRSEKTAQPATMAMTERSSLPHISWQDTTGTGCCTRAKGGRLRGKRRAPWWALARGCTFGVFSCRNRSKARSQNRPRWAWAREGAADSCSLRSSEVSWSRTSAPAACVRSSRLAVAARPSAFVSAALAYAAIHVARTVAASSMSAGPRSTPSQVTPGNSNKGSRRPRRAVA